LNNTLSKLEAVQQKFNRTLRGNKQVSFADVIVLGGVVGIEKAARDAGYTLVRVPFKPGRADAYQKHTDVESFSHLEPKADAFRNYYSSESYFSPAEMLVDKANMLNLTVPEMTVLLGGMRALNANTGGSSHGVFTDTPGVLNPNYFVNLLDMSTKWTKSKSKDGLYEGRDRKTGKLKWTATPVDLIVGSHAELRAIAEIYASDDGSYKFLRDFVDAWTKVMQLDRFDLR